MKQFSYNSIKINKSILSKKKKIISKRKNKSIIIDNKLDEKEDNKNNNIDKEEENINSNSNSKNEKDNKNMKCSLDISLNNTNDSNIRKPIRAKSQQDLNSEGLLDNINNILEKKNKENKSLKKSNKKILK